VDVKGQTGRFTQWYDFSGWTDPVDPSMLPRNLLDQFADRIVVQPFVALLGPIGFVAPFLIGLWAGRRRVLERPAEHLTPLRSTAVVGITIAVVGALPVSVVIAGVIDRPTDHTLSIIGPLHDSTGGFGGFGYAALIVLIGMRLSSRHGRITVAIAAVGQRSLTCYLAQSVVWTVVFTPYLLDLSDTLSTTTTALLAVATWLATVLLAERRRPVVSNGGRDKRAGAGGGRSAGTGGQGAASTRGRAGDRAADQRVGAGQ
jgi:uncharacterized protein